MTTPEKLVEKTSAHVTVLLRKNHPTWAVYHSLAHTLDTVHACTTLAGDVQLDGKEKAILLIAAWFHDTGYIEGPGGHEDRSVERATAFLTEQGCDAPTIEKVNSAITATRLPQAPRSDVEAILCDADVVHAGGDDFLLKSALLRTEMEALHGRTYTDKEWFRFNVSFLEGHPFHTHQARSRFGRQRAENLALLRRMVEQAS